MFIVDKNTNAPLYIQLYKCFTDKILKGELKAGTKLPSSRKLSTDLNLSRNTIDLAYQQLCSEGYVSSKHRHGYYVESLDYSFRQTKNINNSTIRFQESLKDEAVVKYDFRYGKLANDEVPFAQWKKILNNVMKDYEDKMTVYGPTFGEYGLREQIYKYLQYYRGVDCSIDQIFVGAGVHYCLSMICQLLGNHGSIAMEEPGYHISRATFINHGFNIKPITLDKHGLNVKELKASRVNTVYVTPSHQYPLGIIMPISRRIELVEWAINNDALIIEDDYSCHLRYNTNPVQSLQSLCPENVVYIGSFSKFLFPSIRLSYMAIPNKIIDQFLKMFDGYPNSVSFVIQKTVELFMKDGHWDSYLRRNKLVQKKKHDTLTQALREEFGDKISIFGENAGLHIIIKANFNISETELISKASDVGVKVYSTSKFWVNQDNCYLGAVILGFGSIKLEDIKPAVKLLKKAWL